MKSTLLLLVVRGTLRTFFFGMVLLLTVLYVNSDMYDFQKPHQFSGKQFYNPYANWQGSKKVKANFHAYGIPWSQATNGSNTDNEMLDGYQQKGYDLAGISDYHKIIDSVYTVKKGMLYVPMYEHGYNIQKSHELAIGGRKTSYLDFPIWQVTSHKQQVINNLRQNGSLVALSHPNMRSGHTLADATQLSNYQFLEVLSHSTVSLDHWDAALENGRAVWVLSNDDSHGLQKEPIGRNFNLIGVAEKNAKNILSNLRNGNSIGVQSTRGTTDISLEKMSVINDTLHYQFSGNLREVKVIADGKTVDSSDQKSGAIVTLPAWHYVRLEAKGDKANLYCNPVVRFDGNRNMLFESIDCSPKVNWLTTAFHKLGVILIGTGLMFFIIRPFLNDIVMKRSRLEDQIKYF
jgi:hypothetical protein